MATDASYKKIEIQEKPSKKFYRGIPNLLNIPKNTFFQQVLIVALIGPYFFVTVDLTMYAGKTPKPIGFGNIHATLEQPIFALDIIYVVDIITAWLMPKGMKPHRNKFLIFLEALTIVPYEKMYVILLGTNNIVYYWLRMRYIFRLIRFLSSPNFLHLQYTQFKILVNYIGIMSLICITITCFRLFLICHDPQRFGLNCANITQFDVEFTYYMFNSRISNCGILVKGLKIANLQLYFAMLQLIWFIFECVTLSKVICVYIEVLTKKFDFAMTTELLLAAIRKGKKKHGTKWSTDDEHFLMQLRNRISTLWTRFVKGAESIKFTPQHADASFPDIFRIEMALDISWNMFKHSSLFKHVDVHILRFLSRRTKFSEYIAGDIIYSTDDFKNSLIYIMSGILQILAQENAEMAVISFTGGTCIGELSLFLSYPSNCILICKSNCSLITLSRCDFMALKEVFPITYNNLKFAALERLAKAKQYNAISEHFLREGWIIEEKKKTALPYIKRNWKNYSNNKNACVDMLSLGLARKEHYAAKIVFCADYLSLYVLADHTTKNMSNNFLKTGIFFKLKPTSMLICLWNIIIYSCIILTYILYPIGCALASTSYLQVYHFYISTVSILYLIDFLTFTNIAVEGDGEMLISFEKLFDEKIRNSDFWIDFFSSFPLQEAVDIFQGPLLRSTKQILHLPKLFKGYKLLNYLRNMHCCSTKTILVILSVKMFSTFFILLYVTYYIFYLIGFFKGLPLGTTLKETFIPRFEIVIQYILTISLYHIEMDRTYNILPLIGIQYCIAIWRFFVVSKLIAGFSLHLRKNTIFENFVEDVHKLSVLFKFEPYDKRKVEKYLRINYKIGYSMINSKLTEQFVGKTLYRQLQYITRLYSLETDMLFQDLPVNLLKHINEIGEFVLVPKVEIICYAGSMASHIYILVEGYGAYVQENRILRKLELGTAFNVIEALSNLPVVHNIQALSDCKLIRIPVGSMIGKFLKFPMHYHILIDSLKDTIRYDYLKQLQHKEIYIDKSNTRVPSPQFVRFHNRFLEYVYGFGKYSVLRLFILKISIRPNSRFWVGWEICRVILAVLAAFFGSIPITTYTDIFNRWFWIFRFFDLTAFTDIYLRHHLIFYNEKKIEVTHPWKTTCHYWKTSFAVDFLGAIPFDWICMHFSGWENNEILYLILPRLNKYLQIYRFIGVKKYVKEKYLAELRITIIIYYGVIILLLCNLAMPVLFYGNCTINYIEAYIICEVDKYNYWMTYYHDLRILMQRLFTVGIYDNIYDKIAENSTLICFISCVGYMLMWYITGRFTGVTLFKLSYLTTYQIKMQRLIYFVDMCKIDKRLKHEIIKYYEYVWILDEGRNIVSTLEYFHDTLCNEILYSIHAPKLMESFLFKGSAPEFLKELCRSVHTELQHYLIRGVIIRVNDIQGFIYILVKGEVDVLDPSYQQIEELCVGSIFGCLDDVTRHRSTLTYVARTHCDFLCMPVKEFYVILRRYTTVYKYYKYLLKQSNVDFIKSSALERKHVNDLKENVMKRDESLHNKSFRFHRFFRVYKPSPKFVKAAVILCFVSVIFDYFTKIYINLSGAILLIGYLLDILFYCKIYMDFSIAYEDGYGILIYNRKLIALKYLKKFTGFTLNILCVFPFEIFAMCFYYTKYFNQIFNYLACNRLLKIIIVFQYLISLKNRLNINVFFIRSIYILLVVFTMQQITLIILAKYHSVNEHITLFDSYLVPMAYQSYLISKAMYDPTNYEHTRHDHSVLEHNDTAKNEVFEGNHSHDVHTEDNVEIFYNLIIFVTSFLALFIFSECVASYQVLKYNYLRFQSYLKLLEIDMVNKGISPPLRIRIIKYLNKLLSTGRNVQMPSFIISAPFYLKQGILDSMFGYHLGTHPVFKECHSDLLRQLSANFETLFFFKGDFVAYEGDIDGKMYFIHQGVIVGLTEDNLCHESANIKLEVGDYFGFHQIIYKNAGHACSYKVVEDSILLVLRKELAVPLIDFFPASKHIIFNYNSEETS